MSQICVCVCVYACAFGIHRTWWSTSTPIQRGSSHALVLGFLRDLQPRTCFSIVWADWSVSNSGDLRKSFSGSRLCRKNFWPWPLHVWVVQRAPVVWTCVRSSQLVHPKQTKELKPTTIWEPRFAVALLHIGGFSCACIFAFFCIHGEWHWEMQNLRCLIVLHFRLSWSNFHHSHTS